MTERTTPDIQEHDPSDRPTDPVAQGTWIAAQRRVWQRLWHDYFDEDENLAHLPDLVRPDPVPKDMLQDRRLALGLLHTTQRTRKKCFELFPHGEEMLARFEAAMASPKTAMSEEDARAVASICVGLIQEIVPDTQEDLSIAGIVDRDTQEGLDKIQDTDDFTYILEEAPRVDILPQDLPGIAAEQLLTEPLYAAGGNFYDLGNWVCAVQRGGKYDALMTQLFLLNEGGWQLRLSDNGILLAHRKV